MNEEKIKAEIQSCKTETEKAKRARELEIEYGYEDGELDRFVYD